MKSVKLILFATSIISFKTIIPMDPGATEAVAGKGTTFKTWNKPTPPSTTPVNLRALLSSALPVSPKALTPKSPSPVLGAGASTEGIDIDYSSDYESDSGYDSDKSIRYTNKENPPLKELKGSSFVPSSLSGLLGKPDYYGNVLSSIKDKGTYDPRSAEKIFTQVDSNITPLDVAGLAYQMFKCSKKNKTTKPTIPTLVDFQSICQKALEEESRLLMEQLTEQTKKIHQLKLGLGAISSLYSKLGGSTQEEKNSNWGIGSKYPETIDSLVQTVRRADQLLKESKSDSLS